MLTSVLTRIQNFGTVYFVILLLVDIILWKIHPVLGMLGVVFTVALMFGLI